MRVVLFTDCVADEYYDPAKWLMRKIRGRRSMTNREAEAARNGSNGG